MKDLSVTIYCLHSRLHSLGASHCCVHTTMLAVTHATDKMGFSDTMCKLKKAEEGSRVELAMTDRSCQAVVTCVSIACMTRSSCFKSLCSILVLSRSAKVGLICLHTMVTA